jgi:spore coat protein U-like protein
MKSFVLMALVGFLPLGFVDMATAQTATDTFQVRAQVVKVCTIVAKTLDFGTYVSSTASRASTTLTVQCTADTPFSLELGGGGSSNRGDRWMSGPGTLRYGLFKDGGYSQPAATTGADYTGRTDPQGQPVSVQVYGQIAANQPVAAGAYLDTVTVTVTY